MAATLEKSGHAIVRGVRKPSRPDDITVDYLNDTDKESWLPRLEGIDAVLNFVGVLRDSAAQPMGVLHEKTPLALFEACREAGIKRDCARFGLRRRSRH